MVTSLSELCSRANGVVSFVIQGERRQTPDRRRTRRGGRRADDVDVAVSPVDLRAIALRRVSMRSPLPPTPFADDSDDTAGGRSKASSERRPAMMAGRHTNE